MLTSKISPQGTFSLPPEIVHHLQIGPGDMLGFRFEDGRVVIRKVDWLELEMLRIASEAEADLEPSPPPASVRDAA